MDDDETKAALRKLEYVGEIWREVEKLRVAHAIKTHVDPPSVVGPQFVGGPFDGESVVEKCGPGLARERRITVMLPPVFRVSIMMADDAPLAYDGPRDATYEQRRDGHFHFLY